MPDLIGHLVIIVMPDLIRHLAPLRSFVVCPAGLPSGEFRTFFAAGTRKKEP